MRTDEELMAAYQFGDERSFDELFRRYAPVLLGYFQRRGKRPEDSRDLAQQTFLHMHRARFDFRPGELLRPWLFTIARNAFIDHCRKQVRRPERFVDVDAHAAPSAPAASRLARAERVTALGGALARLSGKDRALLDAHWFEEHSFEELARRSGVPSNTLRVRAHRACARLRCFVDPIHATA